MQAKAGLLRAVSRLLTDLTRTTLRLLGRAFEAKKPEPHTMHDWPEDRPIAASESGAGVTQWRLNGLRLRAGWYMLEVEHERDSIGCVLTLYLESQSHEHLLLTSKSVCKRVVRVDSFLTSCTLIIDQCDCSIRRIALVGLTKNFALNRIQTRLEHRGWSNDGADFDTGAWYKAYRSQLHDALLPADYLKNGAPPSVVHTDGVRVDSQPEGPQLLLHKPARGYVDGSVSAAIQFARERGWVVDWHEPTASQVVSTVERRAFHLWVPPNVVFRDEALHQLLRGVEPASVLVYADHDHIDAVGQLSQPVLKPEWNPELLMNVDYIQCPWMLAESWVLQVTKIAPWYVQHHRQYLLCAALGVTGARQVSAQSRGDRNSAAGDMSSLNDSLILSPLTDEQVTRLPYVLASVKKRTLSMQEKRSSEAPRWAQYVRCALSNIGSRACVRQDPQTRYCRVQWPLPLNHPMVDIVIPNRDQVNVIEACVQSILQKTTYGRYRILLVDNNSECTDTLSYYRSIGKNERIKLLYYRGEFNYSAINNYAVSLSDAPIVVLLNNDTEVISPEWLEELVRHASRSEIGCVGAKLHYSNGRVQHGGVIVGVSGVAGHAHRYSARLAQGYCNRLQVSQNYTAVTAACLAVKRDLYWQAGGFDDVDLGVAWNDVDFCLKLRELGYRNVWTPYAQLFHHEGLSRGADDTRSKIKRVDAERQVMMTRWNLEQFNDPAYHPLLSRDSEGFQLGKMLR